MKIQVNSSKAENAGIKIPNNIIVVPERDSPDELCRVEDMANSVKKGFQFMRRFIAD